MLRQRRQSGHRRGAFTLIELLVAISIIAILMSLTVAAAMRVRAAAVRTENKDRMTQIENAANQFMSSSTVGQPGYLPPGPFRVRTNYLNSAGQPDPTYSTETNYLTQLFPRINLGNTGATANADLPDGNAVAVFFLTGGTVTEYEGFSNNPQQPFAPKTQPDEQRKVFIKGVPTKWFRLSPTDDGRHFLDPYGTPYVIFLPNKQGNYGTQTATVGGVTVSPYRRGTKFESPKGIQIISAGPDKLFGAGGDWSTGVSDNGRDDTSNFSSATHASGPQ